MKNEKMVMYRALRLFLSAEEFSVVMAKVLDEEADAAKKDFQEQRNIIMRAVGDFRDIIQQLAEPICNPPVALQKKYKVFKDMNSGYQSVMDAISRLDSLLEILLSDIERGIGMVEVDVNKDKDKPMPDLSKVPEELIGQLGLAALIERDKSRVGAGKKGKKSH